MQEETKKERKLFRVRKADVVADTAEKEDNYQYCLDCWALFMDNDPDRDLGTQRMKLMAPSDAYGESISPDEADYRRRMEIGAATGAMIDSLSHIHRWAIYKLSSMVSVWNFPNADLLVVGPQAQIALREKLRKNILTAVLF